jgi:phage tail sheath protein FI
MPVTPTYPGVYIEEIPSGVRTITGVSTSVTAFVGYFHRGPIDTAVRVSNFGDFEREFGGLHADDETGYAIQQFFLNGGATAWVVRVASSDDQNPLAAAAVTLLDEEGNAVLEALAGRQLRGVSVEDPGEWGNNLHIGVDYVTRDPTDPRLFNLTVSEIVSVEGRRVVLRSEVFANCSTNAASSDYVISKVNDASKMIQLVLADEATPLTRPAQTGTTGAPVVTEFEFDNTTFDSQSPLKVERDSGPDDIVSRDVVLDLPPEGVTFQTHAAQIRSALEQGIRAAGRAATPDPDPYLSGARVTVHEGALRVVAGGETGAGFRPETILRFSDSGALNLDDASASPPGPGISNVQQYRLGTGVASPPAPLGHQLGGEAGGNGLPPDEAALTGSFDAKTGMYALRLVDLFNILVLPSATRLEDTAAAAVYAEAQAFCEAERAFLIVDPPPDRAEAQEAIDWVDDAGIRHRNAAVYFPRIRIPDPLNDNRLRSVGPSGTMAGIYARTDGQRGVWKAPAGLEAVLRGVQDLDAILTDDDNGVLNPLAINALRRFPIYGRVAWGARTLEGADVRASEWKYVPVRRFTLFLEESLYRGLQWVVFEPNDEPLWAQIRLNVGAFLHNLFRLGAFQGASPRDAYFVKCDAETTTQTDIDLGIVNIIVGFAPLKPAEFVIIKIQQLAGQIQT